MAELVDMSDATKVSVAGDSIATVLASFLSPLDLCSCFKYFIGCSFDKRSICSRSGETKEEWRQI